MLDVLILAAGYATRLHPLTEHCAKPLLPVGGQPLIDHLMDSVSRLDGVARIHVVANKRFCGDFQIWAAQRLERERLFIYNDGTFDNADRLGAIGDAAYVIRHAAIDRDLLVVAGDNLFDFDLRAMREMQLRRGTTIATCLFPDRERIKHYSTVEVDGTGRVVAFIEKPPEPTTNRIGICCYLFARRDVPRVQEYLGDGNNPDAPGWFIAWLYRQAPVYAFEFAGLWYDIGDLASLTEADNVLRRRAGLHERDVYEL